ncbi:MAG: flagellar hook protein FlgE [Hyphomonadaceae bacterium]
MSITSAMLAGAAGMRANSSALAAISDNISNVNTVGYKRLRTDFTALVRSQTELTTHSAGGVLASHSTMMSEQGSPIASSVATHLAVEGHGYFVVRQRGDDAAVTDPYYYTRAGQFTPDADGYLRNAAGMYLQGWQVQDDGTVITNPTDLTALVPIQVSGISGDARATENIALTANLQSSVDLNAAVTGGTYDPTVAANSMWDSANSATPVTPDFEIPVQIYDSLGGQHTLTFAYLRQDANIWNVEIYLNGEDGAANTLVSSGQVGFTSTGQYDPTAAVPGTPLPDTLTINAAGGGSPAWPADLGAAALNITMDFGASASGGGLSSLDSPSQLLTSKIDGTPFGALESVEVDDAGVVTAVFTNGLTRKVYQLPLATFPNYDGLVPQSGGAFGLSAAAGPLALRVAGSNGAGGIQSRALESSTVDLAEEFSSLILTQRAYSASSKIITTADEMLDELIRLKR